MSLKITPEVVNSRIEVRFEIFEDADEKQEVAVHTVNTAFPLETDAETIKEEGQKTHDLFFSEREQAIAQKEVDARYEKANSTVAEITGEVEARKTEDEAKSEEVAQ